MAECSLSPSRKVFILRPWYVFVYVCIVFVIDCAAKPRSRHRAICRNVTKQKPKCTIRKRITIPWRAATGRRKEASGSQTEPKGSQMGSKWEPKLVPTVYQNWFKNMPYFQTHPLRNRSELGKWTRNECQVCQNGTQIYAKRYQRPKPKLVAKKIMKIIKDHVFLMCAHSLQNNWFWRFSKLRARTENVSTNHHK